MTTPATRTRHKHPLALACALVPLLGLPAIAAQSDNKQPDNKLEEVVVTASKRDQRLQDFTGSVSVISDFQNIKNISDIANQVPGFNIVDAGPRNPAGLVIRGLRMDEIGSNDLGGDGAAVASYVDNIPLQGYFVPPSFSVKDLQQVEVLRGPQGTLYGNVSIGGLIRYVTAKPDLNKSSVRIGAEISQTDYSDDLNYDTDLVINSPLIDNTLGLRLLLGKTENAGFIDNDYLLTGPAEDINDDQAKEARVSLLWQASDKFSLNTMYHYQKINVGDRQASNESFTGDKYSASSRYLQPMQGELQLASVDATYDIEWATLTASVNHYDYKQYENTDQTGLYIYLDPDYEYYNLYDDLSAYSANAIDVVKDSAELRLVSSDDQSLRWLVGAFYSRDDLDVYMGDFTPGLGEFFGFDLPGDLEYLATQTETLKEYSVYGEVAYDLTEQLEVTVGARYFRYDDQLDSCAIGFPSEDGVPNCDFGDDISKDSLGKLSTKYRISENQNVYFTVAEGYRRGGGNVLPADSTASRFYAPDKATNYELGWRSDWFRQRLQLNAAIYRMDWNDIQVRLTSDENDSYWANAGEGRTQGFEFEASAQLSQAFTLKTGYSYNNAETTEAVASLGINSGDTLPGSPRNQFNIALDYHQPVNTAVIDAGISFSRMGEVYTSLNPQLYNYRKLDSYNTANARVGVTLSNWRVGAFVNNIANSRGITGARTNEVHGDQGQFEYITRPRTIGLSVAYQY